MKKNHLLEEYLRRLRLSTVLREYPKIAQERQSQVKFQS